MPVNHESATLCVLHLKSTSSSGRGKSIDPGRSASHCTSVCSHHAILPVSDTSISGTTYVAPQVLVNVNHGECNPKAGQVPFDSSSFARNGRYDGTNSSQQSMNLDLTRFQEETFGPVVGIQKVTSDEEAIKLMNDSAYGLTASVWTNAEKNPHSEKAFLRIAEELDTGTVFLNR